MSKSLIPLRPSAVVSGLTQDEQSALTWFVISGCSRKDAFVTFARPDMLSSKAKAAIDEYVKQFFARKEVKEYIEAYQATLDAVLHPVAKKTEPVGSLEERKAKAKAKATEFAITLVDNIDQADDPDFVLKLLDKGGILDSGEEVEVAPQRFLAERCSDCRYRVFCEHECEDLCQYCRYRTFGEESGVHYENKDMLDMPNKIGTKIEKENKNE